MGKSKYKPTVVNGRKRDYHRVVMEERIGRTLRFDEVVHHINGDKLDNDINNLCIMSRAEHSKMHQTGRKMSEDSIHKSIMKRRGKLYGTPRKLTDDQVAYIKNNCIPFDKDYGVRAMARKFGMSHSEISRLLNGKTYTSTEQFFTDP